MSSAPTIITNRNIHDLVKTFVETKWELPVDLRDNPIGEWDVSRVTNMQSLFKEYKEFNEPLNDWDVSNVTNMNSMFYKCQNFDQPLNRWKVGNVTTMKHMFIFCKKFNQSLNDWDVGRVTDMEFMFSRCDVFDQPLDKWNVGRVTNMHGMFFTDGCIFNQSLNVWDVRNVTNMSNMFHGCKVFNQPLDKWGDKIGMVNMTQLFYACEKFNQPIGNWDVRNVKLMGYMFSGCKKFNQPLNDWNVRNVTDMDKMFEKCRSFNQPLTDWHLKDSVGKYSMFEDCPILERYKPVGVRYRKLYVEPVPNTNINTILRKFYEEHHRGLPHDLPEKCRGEDHCPITGFSLKRLQRLKRLVVLDGRCYAFHVFAPDNYPKTDPFTRQPWSRLARDDIDFLRKYKDVLKEEYKQLPVDTPPTPPQRMQPLSPLATQGRLGATRGRPRSRARTMRQTRSLSMTPPPRSETARPTRRTRRSTRTI
jgi:surface protein